MESKKELIKVWPRIDLTKETYMTRVTGPRGGMRGYEREGIKGTYPSVTTVLSTINKPALPVWYAKVVAEKAGELLNWNRDANNEVMYPPDVAEFVKEIKSAPSESFKESGDIGTSAHDLINQAIRYKMDNPYTTWDEVAGEIRPIAASIDMLTGEQVVHEQSLTAFDSWMNWVKSMPTLQFLETEFATFLDKEEKPRYAGTVDAVASIGGKLVVFDWKTSNSVYKEAAYQVAAYCYSIWASGISPFEPKNDQGWSIRTAFNSLNNLYNGITGMVVRLDKTDSNKYEMYQLESWQEIADTFNIVLDLYNALKSPVYVGNKNGQS